MTIRHKCEGCGSVLKIKDELAGKPGKCPKCKAKFIVGATSSGSHASDLSDEDLLPTSDTALPTLDSPLPSSEGTSGVPFSDFDDEPAKPAKPPKPSARPDDEEDDIFGKDFFTAQEPASRPQFTMPNYDDHVIPDDDPPAEKPAKGGASKGAKASPEPAATAPSSVDSAASIASQLLAKTGKKNKTSKMIEMEAQAEEEAQKVDYSELKYLLTHKVLPYGLGAVVLVSLLYWMMSSALGNKSSIPPLGTVAGTVMYQGKPIANAEIRFNPVSADPGVAAKGSFSYGFTDANGAYEMHYNPENRGAAVGNHRVVLIIGGAEMGSRDVEVKAGRNDIPLSFD